jgi:tetrahydromethanopterin S-methyltransferase subunit C
VSPLIIVLIVGVVLHTIVGVITRTPEEDQTPLRWKCWHTFLIGLGSVAVILAVMAGYYMATGVLLPYWALLLATDVLTLGWKLRKHQQRVRERSALQNMFDRPSLGEGA